MPDSTHAPPPLLDNAHVLWWAWSGEKPFGELHGVTGDDRWVYGLAVCQYDTGEIYRFSCDKRWEVVQDMDHPNEDQAKRDIPSNYDAARVHWVPYVASPPEGPANKTA